MAKVVCLLNTINRQDMVIHTCELNAANAGHEVDWYINDNGSTQKEVILWGERYAKKHWSRGENIGNPQGLNLMLKEAMNDGYDWFAIHNDDIDLPNNWLLEAFSAKDKLGDKCGIIGFSWRGLIGPDFDASIGYFTPKRVFGAWVLHRDVIEKCGYFAEFSKYGLWDSEYNERTRRAGLINIYTNQASVHKGGNERNDNPYRVMKDNELAKAKAGFDALMAKEITYLAFEDRNYELG